MIEITKSEAKAVRKVFPHACIAKTRHKRYLEESARYLELLPFNIAAVEMLKQMQRNARYYGRYNGIVYIVSPTQEEKQGYLPGTQE